MKREFSTAWKSSSQVRKQRKYRHNAPLHIRSTFLNAPLSKDLKKKYGMRSIGIRKGDEVQIARGSFKGKKAKVQDVDLKRGRINLENITRQKKDGSKIPVFFNPSKVLVLSLFGDDKKRLKRHNKTEKKVSENASNKI